ncbi:lysophospholipid acyltransferase family protein [Litorihabitans aurantiacus]|uniref:1-acyl-sn-glycerol-3-phosphate acyltransferase n=1 Tax=Litorihabitans aurantiacus TaxID=1930061 RepID=A0AA38CRL0_9MICO|nr:lysophospholipid acyltransferase family protein [Litorihabitans aurantiacus]GMA32858.1 1-acyl-sn-glycerol-3-phosphate acyltransferase [Litorihabitans aurantiacus]
MPQLFPDALGRALVAHSVGRSLRRSFDSIAVAGDLPRGGAVLASTHSSWWDGYVLAALAGAVGTRPAVMMTARRLAAFPFLRLVGAVDTGGARDLVRAAAAGRWAVVFPEGELQPRGRLAPLHPGAAWVARTAGAPLVPVALAVVTRGAPQPEVLVRMGQPLSTGPRGTTSSDVAALTTALAERLRQESARLADDVAAAHPEHPVPGYRVLLHGTSRRRDSVGWAVRALAWLTGVPSRREPAPTDRCPR